METSTKRVTKGRGRAVGGEEERHELEKNAAMSYL